MNRKFPQFPLPSSALLGNELVLIWKNGANRRLAISELGAFLSGLEGFDGNPSSLNQEGATTGQVLTWDGTQWSPDTAGGFDGNPSSLNQEGATEAQILVWNGTNWASTSNYVDKTSDEDIDGTKTFLDSVRTNGALMLQNNLVVDEQDGYATINYDSTRKFKFKIPQDVEDVGFEFLLGDLTAYRGYTLPDTTGTIALESYVDDAIFTDFEPSTGNLSFAPVDGKPKKYGFTTALTGNITFTTTSAKETVMIKARWNDSTLPTVSVSGGGVTLVKTGDFVISVDNFIDAVCDKNDAGTVTSIRYSITQA